MRNPIRRSSILLLPVLLTGLLFVPRSAMADANNDARLSIVRDALVAAENGRLDPSTLRALADHPLASWIDFAQTTWANLWEDAC